MSPGSRTLSDQDFSTDSSAEQGGPRNDVEIHEITEQEIDLKALVFIRGTTCLQYFLRDSS